MSISGRIIVTLLGVALMLPGMAAGQETQRRIGGWTLEATTVSPAPHPPSTPPPRSTLSNPPPSVVLSGIDSHPGLGGITLPLGFRSLKVVIRIMTLRSSTV